MKTTRAAPLRTEEDYGALAAEIVALERKFHLYLFDENVDRENAVDGGHPEGSAGFWDAMYASLCSSAGSRAEQAKFDLNGHLGRSIY